MSFTTYHPLNLPIPSLITLIYQGSNQRFFSFLVCGLFILLPTFLNAQTSPTPSRLASQDSASTQTSGDLQLQHAESQKLWDELHQELLSLGQLHARHEKLPEPSIFKPFSDNKKRNQKKIDQLAKELLGSIGYSPMDTLFKKRKTIVQQIKIKKAKIVKIEESLFGASEKGGLFQKSKKDYQDQLLDEQKELDALTKDLEMNYMQIQQTFEAMGIKVSIQQVKDLFTVVSGSTMKTFFIRFSNLRLLSDMIAYFLNKNQNNQGYSGQAKRYYGIYVALVSLLIEAHEEAIRRIQMVHLPKIKTITQSTQTQIQKTKSLMNQPGQEMNRSAYQQNLDIQLKLLNASKSYAQYLNKQHKEIEKTLIGLRSKFTLILNTYQTVSLANQLVSAMKAGVKDIQDLQSLKLPDMIPLSDQQLREEFMVVDQQINLDPLDDLGKE